jgi:hypothetical protein
VIPPQAAGLNEYFNFKLTQYRKKAENLAFNLALHYMHYNFCRVHQTLRVTPAMEAGIADHVWEIEELVALVENEERAAVARGEMKRGKYKIKN